MNNLENEFDLLVQSLYEQIQDKQNKGTLTFDEAQALRSMVNSRVETTDPWQRSSCYEEDPWVSSATNC
jgi:hypothetical protein